MRLLLLLDDWLVWLEVFANPLVDGLLAYFVVIGGLHFDHVLQIRNVRGPVLLALRILSSPPSELFVNIDARVALSFCRCYLKRRFILGLYWYRVLCILLASRNDRHAVVLEVAARACSLSQILLADTVRLGLYVAADWGGSGCSLVVHLFHNSRVSLPGYGGRVNYRVLAWAGCACWTTDVIDRALLVPAWALGHGLLPVVNGGATSILPCVLLHSMIAGALVRSQCMVLAVVGRRHVARQLHSTACSRPYNDWLLLLLWHANVLRWVVLGLRCLTYHWEAAAARRTTRRTIWHCAIGSHPVVIPVPNCIVRTRLRVEAHILHLGSRLIHIVEHLCTWTVVLICFYFESRNSHLELMFFIAVTITIFLWVDITTSLPPGPTE